jgi:hypothetical protein
MKIIVFFLITLASFVTAQTYPMGAVWNEKSYRSIPYKATLTKATYENLPSSFSLENFSPYPGDQGNYGTCVAYATAYGLRTTMWAKDNNLTDRNKITQAALSPSYLYYIIRDENDNECKLGANPILGMEALKVAGTPTLQTVPYSCNPSISQQAQMEAIDYKIRDYQAVFILDEISAEAKVNATKKALSEGYPIQLTMKLPSSFFEATEVWKSTEQDIGNVASVHGIHTMVVMGYDDKKAGGAFRVLNSWGQGWGDKGYIWIPYKEYGEWSLAALQPYSYYEKKEEKPVPPPIPVEKPIIEEIPTPDPDYNPITKTLPEGSLKFVTNQGEPMEAARTSTRNLVVEDDVEGEELVAYKMTKSYPSGTRFRFFLENKNEAYIYAFATDLTQKINQILPFADNMSPLIGADSELAFPSETKIIKMDDNPGTDYLLILFSQEKLNEKEIYSIMQETKGSLTTKIKTALGDKLIDKNEIMYTSQNPGFKVKENAKGYVVPLMVEISHK